MKPNKNAQKLRLSLNKRTISVLKQNQEQQLQGGNRGLLPTGDYCTNGKTCCPKSLATFESCTTSQ
jgi:hypothetical protein